MRRFVALDQSLSSCGWAIWDEGDELPVSGAIPLCDGIKTRAKAFVGLHRMIAKWQGERRIELLAFEQPLKVPIDKIEKLIALYGLVAHIESICDIKQVLCLPVDARDWRGTWLGDSRKGKTTFQLKRLAVERARQYGCDPVTHDEAEAIGILDHMLLDYRVTPPWRKAHPFLEELK